jgi:hypothetical protein
MFTAAAQVVAGCGKAGHPSTDGGADGREESAGIEETGGLADAGDAAVDLSDATVDSGGDSGRTDADVMVDATDMGDGIDAPGVSQNPPVPAGWQLMPQADVTAEMTAWAVAILDDPATYPMFATATMTFGTLTVLARVEWHPPDFQDSVVHRGVTLYEPI